MCLSHHKVESVLLLLLSSLSLSLSLVLLLLYQGHVNMQRTVQLGP